MRKVYQLWPGRNRFCCGAKCITGPSSDCAANSCYYVCLLVIMIPYYIFLAPPLWNNMTPALPICTSICVVLSFVFFMLVSCTDPGIIPRRAFLERNREKYQQFLMPDMSNTEGQSQRRFCDTCQIYRPPRASHCSSCQNCVQVFDHHCPFVNNCVGKRNYQFFLGFLGGVIMSLAMAMISLIIFLIGTTGGSINQTVVIIISAIVGAVIGLPLLGFLIFHIVLAVKGTTTRQIIKKQNNQGPKNNWCQRDPTIIDYLQTVTNEQYSQIQTILQKPKGLEQTNLPNLQLP